MSHSQRQPGSWDVVIIGGGPAGAAAATVLARHGRQVLVLEREKFPRYHVGESLLPFTFYPLERLGLIPRLRASAFVKKYSVQFVSPSGRASQPFYFFTRYDRETVAQTWQVWRADFDQMLLENAREAGATVMEGVEVTGLIERDGRIAGVEGRNAEGRSSSWRARTTLDCSGKSAFAATRLGWRLRDPELNKLAVWTYYRGAQRDEGIDAGATTVAMIPQKGWFWYIPLQEDRVSVGVVAEGRYLTREGVRNPREIFEREIPMNPWIADHLSVGRQEGPYYLTSEYSFHSRYTAREGLLLAGDAFAFLDPVFSSGLLLALKSGVMAGDAIHEAIEAGDLRPERFTTYARTIRAGLENMRKLVYAFYHENFSFREVIRKYPDLAGDITDCLSGDVNKDFSRLWAAIQEFAPLPEALPVGLPESVQAPVAP